MVQGDYLQLIFEGVDTYADVYLNDKLILQTDNMFVQYAVDCKDVIQVQITFGPFLGQFFNEFLQIF